MKFSTLTNLAGLTTLLFLANAGSAMTISRDAEGSKDHPLVSRYPGALIRNFYATDFDEYHFVTGPLKNDKLPMETVEGKYTTIVYELPDSVSSLQVFKNYEQAFAKAGANNVLSCNQLTCGEYLPSHFVKSFGTNEKISRYNPVDLYSTGKDADYRFWTGILERNGTKTYLTFMIHKNSSVTRAFLDIVEQKSMNTGLVKLDLNSLDAAIKSQGKAILDGIYFDNDKAVVKPESGESMKVIADYLKTHAKTKVYVVGHTDNNGNYKHNLQLSQQRADAVVSALIKDFKLDANRLTAVGVGPVCPATTNNDDAGKAKNRRVELVVQ